LELIVRNDNAWELFLRSLVVEVTEILTRNF